MNRARSAVQLATIALGPMPQANCEAIEELP